MTSSAAHAGRLAEARSATARRIDALAARVDDIVEGAAWETGDDEHDPEGSTIAFERAQAQALLAAARADLTRIEQATQRLGDGTYGRCGRCGNRIAEGRLEALPAADTCIGCADRRRR